MLPRLHVVTDDTVLGRPDAASLARRIIEQLGREVALHVRARAVGGRRLFEFVNDLEPVARESGALLIVNDRVDVALAAQMRAVHLSTRSLPLRAARTLVGSGVRLGWSAHTADEVAYVAAEGANFVLLGTIWPSASHPGGPVGGTTLIQAAATHALPVIAIGGITHDRVAAATSSGAYGVAVISSVWGATDPVRSAWDLVEELKANVEDA